MVKKHSCGAILYTILNYNIYIILGKERGDWFPFKGTSENMETIKQTAIREIAEETCNCVVIKEEDISLDCNFQTSRKHYHIGLIYTDYDIMKKFYKNKKKFLEKKFLEKSKIAMFHINKIKNLVDNFHYITMVPILYYYPILVNLQNELSRNKPRNNTTKLNTNTLKS